MCGPAYFSVWHALYETNIEHNLYSWEVHSFYVYG